MADLREMQGFRTFKDGQTDIHQLSRPGTGADAGHMVDHSFVGPGIVPPDIARATILATITT